MRKSNVIQVKKEEIDKILSLLRKHYANAVTALNFSTPFEMLVATILSAQCTDTRVNLVTPSLFKRYPKVSDYAEADIKNLESLIRSTGFYHNKARNIKGAAMALIKDFGGVMPRKLDEMVNLPGVGRKTGSVVLFNVYGVIEGIVVDTHVGRISRRLGFSNEKDAVKVERDLMKVIPREDWANYSFWLIDHGRSICKSVKPACDGCFLNKLCPSAFEFDEKGKWKGLK